MSEAHWPSSDQKRAAKHKTGFFVAAFSQMMPILDSMTKPGLAEATPVEFWFVPALNFAKYGFIVALHVKCNYISS